MAGAGGNAYSGAGGNANANSNSNSSSGYGGVGSATGDHDFDSLVDADTLNGSNTNVLNNVLGCKFYSLCLIPFLTDPSLQLPSPRSTVTTEEIPGKVINKMLQLTVALRLPVMVVALSFEISLASFMSTPLDALGSFLPPP